MSVLGEIFFFLPTLRHSHCQCSSFQAGLVGLRGAYFLVAERLFQLFSKGMFQKNGSGGGGYELYASPQLHRIVDRD